jgi:hypothetical protein
MAPRVVGQDEPLQLQTWRAEVDQQTDGVAGRLEIVQYLRGFDRSKFRQRLDLDDNLVKANKVCSISARQFRALVNDGEFDLVSKRHTAFNEFECQCVLINRLEKTAAENSLNLNRGADNVVRPRIAIVI